MELIEVETSFGSIAAGEQALVDAIREMLREDAVRRATVTELLESLGW